MPYYKSVIYNIEDCWNLCVPPDRNTQMWINDVIQMFMLRLFIKYIFGDMETKW